MIMGVMIESNLFEGRQSIPAAGPSALLYGVSVTDGKSKRERRRLYTATHSFRDIACIDWDTTVPVLDRLRDGVQARRAAAKSMRMAGPNGSGTPKLGLS